jgi:acyl-CoA hydrolase
MMDEVALLLPLDLLEKMCNCFFWQNWFYQVPAGTIIELIGTVTRIGNTSLDVKVEIYIEQMYSNHREKRFQELYFVALDENKTNKKFSMIS